MSGFDDDDDDDDDDFTYVDNDALEPLALPLEDDNDEPGLTPEQVAAALERSKDRTFEPKPYAIKSSKKRLAIVDTETDPFAIGLVVKPFTLGFFDGETYVDFWGDDCVDQFFDHLDTLPDDYIIYAHNGGKFDFFFFLSKLAPGQTPLIMNGRLVKIQFGKQEFRDSFAIIPQALGAYKKDEIDYSVFTRDKRERHKEAILEYQKSDCIYTFELIAGFHEMFGDKLTIASAALPTLHSLHGFQRIRSEAMDARFREYYFGGRNQCFETGVLKPRPGRTFRMYDRRSMYPSAMKDELHPISSTFTLQRDIQEDTDFACIVARNDGALPVRDAMGGLDFTVKRGTFHATIHEIRAGLETGTLRIERVKHAWTFHRKASFGAFVDQFDSLRQLAKDNGDLVRSTLYKFCLNSPYGKFALNPRKFKQWMLTVDEIAEPLASKDNPDGWTLHTTSGSIYIWSRPSPRRTGFYNVATAASITGAARANLLRNIAMSDRPIYCDTDSILCEGFRGKLGNKLGDWQLEAEGDTAAIAGKKLYALFNQEEVLKKASKGVNLSALDIVSVCNGNEVLYENPVPNFSLDGSAKFVSRRVNKTGVI